MITSKQTPKPSRGRPPRAAEGAIETARQLVLRARNADELRAAQAVLLPLLGLTLDQTAAAVGKSRFWVSRARNALLAGKSPPAAHGGRRNAIVEQDEEVALLQQAIRNAHDHWDPMQFRTSRVRAAVRGLLDRRSGRVVTESTVRAFMNRAVPKLMPELQGAPYAKLADALDQYWHAQWRVRTVAEHPSSTPNAVSC